MSEHLFSIVKITGELIYVCTADEFCIMFSDHGAAEERFVFCNFVIVGGNCTAPFQEKLVRAFLCACLMILKLTKTEKFVSCSAVKLLFCSFYTCQFYSLITIFFITF